MIKLIHTFPDGDLHGDTVIVNDARTSYNGVTEYPLEKRQKLLNYLYTHRHWSPFEMAEVVLFDTEPQWEVLTDPRWRLWCVPRAGGVYVRIDINNLIKLMRAYPDSHIGEWAHDELWDFVPWTMEALTGQTFTGTLSPVEDTPYGRQILFFNDGWVQQRHNPIPETVVIDFARQIRGWHTLDDSEVIRQLWAQHDTRVYALISWKVVFNMPVVSWWQLVRHRMSYNLQSGRYVKYPDSRYIPTAWRRQSEDNKQGSQGEVDDQGTLHRLYNRTSEEAYQAYTFMLDRGVAKEQARLNLNGMAYYHRGVVKGGLDQWINAFHLRLQDEAQHEIRVPMKKAWWLFKQAYPLTAEMMNV